MIVQPDFLTHWKTKALVNELGPEAPLYLLRLWAHCQNRRSTSTFEDLPPAAVKAICEFDGEPAKLAAALIASRWIEREGPLLRVLNWDDHNRQLIANRENGRKGGRPSKSPAKAGSEPMASCIGTHGEATANPKETDKKREEKKKIEKRGEDDSPKGRDYSPEFEEFWEAYPRKSGGKPDTFKAYQKALKEGADHRSILSAVIEQRESKDWLKEDGQFVPYPATWLNKGRWTDELAGQTNNLPEEF